MSRGGLYLHIPFCRRLCFYCHFYRVPYETGLAERTVDSLCRELRIRASSAPSPDTVYFGGGSPSLLQLRHLEKLLDAAAANCSIPATAEITLEANPEDLNLNLLKGYRRLGINRLSIGVQSFAEGELRRLKRTHTPQQALAAIRRAQKAGFSNISIDLLIGIVGQSQRSLEQNLLTAGQSGIPHLSLYILEGIPGKKQKTAAGRDSDLYAFARSMMRELGYQQYEVSNFSLPNRCSRHNLKYWQNLPYLGIGPSASSYIDGIDWRNSSNLASYINRLQSGRWPLQVRKTIKPEIRRMVTGLRLRKGLPASAFSPFPEAAAFLLQNGLLRRYRDHIVVPEEKIMLLNEILIYFF